MRGRGSSRTTAHSFFYPGGIIMAKKPIIAKKKGALPIPSKLTSGDKNSQMQDSPEQSSNLEMDLPDAIDPSKPWPKS